MKISKNSTGYRLIATLLYSFPSCVVFYWACTQMDIYKLEIAIAVTVSIALLALNLLINLCDADLSISGEILEMRSLTKTVRFRIRDIHKLEVMPYKVFLTKSMFFYKLTIDNHTFRVKYYEDNILKNRKRSFLDVDLKIEANYFKKKIFELLGPVAASPCSM